MELYVRLKKPMITKYTLAIVVAAMTACSVQPESTLLRSDIDKLHQRPSIGSNKFDLNITLGDGDGVVFSESKSSRVGVATKFTKLRKFVYPKSYSLPSNGENGKAPTAPPIPQKFDSFETGWTVALKPRVSGGVIILEGEITHVSAKLHRGVFGEGSDPVVDPVSSVFGKRYVTVTENVGEMPLISKTTYPITVRVLPNKQYKVVLSDGTNLKLTLNEK